MGHMERNFRSEDTLSHRNANVVGCFPYGKSAQRCRGEVPDIDESKFHPSLRGGRFPTAHHFSKTQMDVLTALCDTIFPYVAPHKFSGAADRAKGDPSCLATQLEDEAFAKLAAEEEFFYRISASDLEVPKYAAGYMTLTMKPLQLKLIGIVLILLSTRLGTFFLCGTRSLIKTFPFIRAFPHIRLDEREKILRAWSLSLFYGLQLFFKLLKSVVGWTCFTAVDNNGYNPTWKAIGYHVPSLEERRQCSGTASRARPLEGKVISVKEPGLCDRLRDSGFNVREGDPQGQEVEKASSQLLDLTVKCDAVVIGSGSGGGVVAGVLAKAGYKVLIMEKGGYFARDDYSGLEGPSVMEMEEGLSHLVTKDATVILKAGATVGGGSAVNWSASLRTPEHVLREWAEQEKLAIFGEKRYQEALEAVCDRMKVQAGVAKESLQNTILRKGCQRLNYHVEDMPCNNGPDHYCGWCEFGCVGGGKQSTAETWLVDAAEHGAVILAGCYVEAVMLQAGGRKGRRAAGAVAQIGRHGVNRLFVEAQVTVAAGGALHTPALLRRSGLSNPHIGHHLHLHPSLLAWGYVDPKWRAEIDLGHISHGQTSFEGGIITAFSRECARWESDGYGSIIECPSIHPGSFSVVVPWTSGIAYKHAMHRYSRTCVLFTLTRDRTDGVVSSSSDGHLEIDYRLSSIDRALMLDALQHAIRILDAAPCVTHVGTMSLDGGSFFPSHPNKLDTYLASVQTRGIRDVNYCIQSAHQMGTCRMGVDPLTSVVDPTCEAWEVEGLFLGDTSVFPTALGVNPMVTVQAIAYCTAQNIILYLKPPGQSN